MSTRSYLTAMSLAVLFATACAEPLGTDPVDSVEIQPQSVEVIAGAEQRFTAVVHDAADSGVLWSASGGGFAAEGNSIAWTAPTTAGTYEITATSAADPARKGTATVRVVEPAPPATTFAPEFSHAAGFYTDPFHLALSSASPEATIYYTVDGSDPDPARIMDDATWAKLPIATRTRTYAYSAPIDLARWAARADDISLIPTGVAVESRAWRAPLGDSYKATVVRALAMAGTRTSESLTNTYFITPRGAGRYTLPVVSVATARGNFFAEDIGIYVQGITGENYNERGDEWERPISFELFGSDGRRLLAHGAGMRIHGGYTRQFAQKSLRLYARGEYGTGRFAYPFFQSKPQDDFKRVIMRAAGHDNAYGHLRDALLQTLVQHLPFETQHYQPLILFINGEYWGLHEFRDRYDDHHLGIRYGLDRSQVVIMEDDASYADGDYAGRDDYGEFLARVTGGTLRSWEEIDAEMDLDGYLDYIIAEMYAGNTDWPHSNIKYWRYRGPSQSGNPYTDGRWRWLMVDVDWSFGYNAPKTTNMVEWLLVNSEEPWARALFRGLLEIPAVRHDFLQRAAVHLETTFRPDRVRPHIDSLALVIRLEMEEQIRRWTRPASLSAWQNEVDKMLDFAADRPTIFRQHVADHFDEVTGTAALRITRIAEGQGLRLHTLPLSAGTPGVRISGGSWTGELFTGIPVVLTAEHLDLTRVVVSGAVADLVRTPGELRFVMTGAVGVELP